MSMSLPSPDQPEPGANPEPALTTRTAKAQCGLTNPSITATNQKWRISSPHGSPTRKSLSFPTLDRSPEVSTRQFSLPSSQTLMPKISSPNSKISTSLHNSSESAPKCPSSNQLSAQIAAKSGSLSRADNSSLPASSTISSKVPPEAPSSG